MNKDSIKKNWQEIPLEDFKWMLIEHADGTTTEVHFPHGDGVLQRFMADLWVLIDKTYETLSSDEESDRFATAYEVPVIRDGKWGYEPQHKLTFQDLPAPKPDAQPCLRPSRTGSRTKRRSRLSVERHQDQTRAISFWCSQTGCKVTTTLLAKGPRQGAVLPLQYV
jgi:hypothetical protein